MHLLRTECAQGAGHLACRSGPQSKAAPESAWVAREGRQTPAGIDGSASLQTQRVGNERGDGETERGEKRKQERGRPEMSKVREEENVRKGRRKEGSNGLGVGRVRVGTHPLDVFVRARSVATDDGERAREVIRRCLSTAASELESGVDIVYA